MSVTRARMGTAALLAGCLAFSMSSIVEYVAAGAGLELQQKPAASGQKKPDDNRFTAVVVVPAGELDEPMVFQVLRDGSVLIIERKGVLKLYDAASKTTKVVAKIPVNTKYTNAAGEQREAEEGLVGMTIDPGFEKNRWIYMLYADPDVAKHSLARWTLEEKKDADGQRTMALVEASKKVLLEYTVQREQCCHTGGGMAWDKDGNLYMTVGNNTSNSLGMQSDERPGRQPWDDQRGAANTNDLRGKILRIHPEPDGTYTIPKGNLFPPGTAGTRPEIYTMGNRNPWRVNIDSKTGYVYWGEVGPDANEDTEIGPRGYDEHNQAKSPGFFGWPYFVGENKAFPYFDFVTNKPTTPKDPAKPINSSVNNTGLRELPPAQPSFISYPYGPSDKFPEVGSGARSANGGPVYRRADYPDAKRPFPEYYEGKWFISDFSRAWIMAVTLDEQSNYVSMERFLPDLKLVEPIDTRFGPDGDLYVLDYGSTWFAKSPDASLIRIEYNGGNRTPTVQITSDRSGGRTPFKVAFSSAGTRDYDGDQLKYEWTIESADGSKPRVFTQPNPSVAFDKDGIYVATLTVTDPAGAHATASLDIIAGNDPPAVAINVSGANKSFFTPKTPIQYSVTVADREDGSVAAQKIAPDAVALSIDYVSEGFDVASVSSREKVDATTRYGVGKALMSKTDCATCHNRDTKSRGPSFLQLAEKYQPEPDTLTQLAEKVRTGSTGVWGPEVMPAHPQISAQDARTIVRYMLNLGTPAGKGDAKLNAALPLEGTYTPIIPPGDNGRGAVIIRAVYTDKGAKPLPELTSEAITVLRSPRMSPATADIKSGVTQPTGRGSGGTVLPGASSHIGFKALDLTGVKTAELMAQATARGGEVGGTIEIRIDSPTGPVIGTTTVARPGTEKPVDADAPAPAGGRGFGPKPAVVSLKPTTGVHDLYFVFRNEKASGVQRLMSLSQVTLTF